MTIDEQIVRDKWTSIAVVEHHNLPRPELSAYDIADGLAKVWSSITPKIQAEYFTFDVNTILELNAEIVETCNGAEAEFRDKEGWERLIQDIFESSTFEDDPSHISSWIFSALYWKHLEGFSLSTAWIYVNAIRLQHGFSEVIVSLDRLGHFLKSLSDSGPPISDGQTLNLEHYYHS